MAEVAEAKWEMPMVQGVDRLHHCLRLPHCSPLM